MKKFCDVLIALAQVAVWIVLFIYDFWWLAIHAAIAAVAIEWVAHCFG